MLEEAQEDQAIHIVIREFSQSEALISPSELKDPHLVDHLLLSENLKMAASYQGNIVKLRMLIEHHLEIYGPGRPIRRPGSEARSSIKPRIIRIANNLLEDLDLLRSHVSALTGLSQDPWPSDEVLAEELTRMNSDE